MNLLRSTQLISTAFAFSFLAACSDSGGGPGIPQDAVVITASNAEVIASEAVGNQDGGTGNFTSGYKPGDNTPETNTTNAKLTKFASLATDYFSKASDSVVGVTETVPCQTGEMVFNGTPGVSFTVDYNDCSFFGETANGTLTINITETTTSLALRVRGNLTISDGVYTISLTGLDTTDTLLYSDTTYAYLGYTIDTTYAISGIPVIGGYLFQTIEPIAGYSIPTSGQIMISGGSGSRLRITFNSNQTITVELDNGNGTFVELANSPYSYYSL